VRHKLPIKDGVFLFLRIFPSLYFRHKLQK
jgi:hypothetical protein